MRNIAILGSTGSIGRQTLDIIAEYDDRFRACLLVANNNADLLIEQSLRFLPDVVVIANQEHYAKVKDALARKPIKVMCGNDAIADAVMAPEIDVVVTAMVGYSGLLPTIRAIEAGKVIALANKETLVVAGELITGMLKESNSVLYPVDSEHGAFYQCMVGERRSDVSKLILTASGGPFWNKSVKELDNVTVADALNHPNWNMGAKITIDSATMMNKGFEMIEARWLFDVMPQDIEIVVHRQSIVHSMVEFVDGSVKAQLGLPDMHLPIRYALGLPSGRLSTPDYRMTIDDYANLTFERPDFAKFPLLRTAYEAAAHGGTAPCVVNAANEIAVAAFLNGEIGFKAISRLVDDALNHVELVKSPRYDDYVAVNAEARRYTQCRMKEIK